MTNEHLPEHLRPLFWDYDFERLGWPDSRDLVIARILQNGGDHAIRWLRQEVSDGEVSGWIRDSRGQGLDPRRLRFWQLVLPLPSEEVDRWIEDLRTLPRFARFS